MPTFERRKWVQGVPNPEKTPFGQMKDLPPEALQHLFTEEKLYQIAKAGKGAKLSESRWAPQNVEATLIDVAKKNREKALQMAAENGDICLDKFWAFINEASASPSAAPSRKLNPAAKEFTLSSPASSKVDSSLSVLPHQRGTLAESGKTLQATLSRSGSVVLFTTSASTIPLHKRGTLDKPIEAAKAAVTDAITNNGSLPTSEGPQHKAHVSSVQADHTPSSAEQIKLSPMALQPSKRTAAGNTTFKTDMNAWNALFESKLSVGARRAEEQTKAKRDAKADTTKMTENTRPDIKIEDRVRDVEIEASITNALMAQNESESRMSTTRPEHAAAKISVEKDKLPAANPSIRVLVNNFESTNAKNAIHPVSDELPAVNTSVHVPVNIIESANAKLAIQPISDPWSYINQWKFNIPSDRYRAKPRSEHRPMSSRTKTSAVASTDVDKIEAEHESQPVTTHTENSTFEVVDKKIEAVSDSQNTSTQSSTSLVEVALAENAEAESKPQPAITHNNSSSVQVAAIAEETIESEPKIITQSATTPTGNSPVHVAALAEDKIGVESELPTQPATTQTENGLVGVAATTEKKFETEPKLTTQLATTPIENSPIRVTIVAQVEIEAKNTSLQVPTVDDKTKNMAQAKQSVSDPMAAAKAYEFKPPRDAYRVKPLSFVKATPKIAERRAPQSITKTPSPTASRNASSQANSPSKVVDKPVLPTQQTSRSQIGNSVSKTWDLSLDDEYHIDKFTQHIHNLNINGRTFTKIVVEKKTDDEKDDNTLAKPASQSFQLPSTLAHDTPTLQARASVWPGITAAIAREVFGVSNVAGEGEGQRLTEAALKELVANRGEIQNESTLTKMAGCDLRSNVSSYDSGATVKNKNDIRAVQGNDATAELLDFDGRMMPSPVDWEFDRNFDDTFIPAYVKEWKEKLPCGPSVEVDVSSANFTEGQCPINNAVFMKPIVQPPTIPDVANSDNDEKRRNQTAGIDANNFAVKFNAKLLYHKLNKKVFKEQQDAIALHHKLHPEPSAFAPKTQMYLRPAMAKDCQGIAAIYNHYVSNGFVTEDKLPVPPKDFEAFFKFTKQQKLPFIVAVKGLVPTSKSTIPQIEEVIGFAFTEPAAYGFAGTHNGRSRFTGNMQLYVSPQCLRKRVGNQLLDRLLHCMSSSHGYRAGSDWINPDNDGVHEADGSGNWHQIYFKYPVRDDDDPVFQGVKQFLWGFYFKEDHRELACARTPRHGGFSHFADLVTFGRILTGAENVCPTL